jgi:hypothetical protein
MRNEFLPRNFNCVNVGDKREGQITEAFYKEQSSGLFVYQKVYK